MLNKLPSIDQIKLFYTDHLNQFGESSKGVGWKNDLAQTIRFEQLIKVISHSNNFTINDLGCGVAQFYFYLLENKYVPSKYRGYDILKEMIEASNKLLNKNDDSEFFLINSIDEMLLSDYSVSSGTFNVKYSTSNKEWGEYVKHSIEMMNLKSRLGFSFNLLSTYSDPEYRQEYLYYANPLEFFDFCKQNFSKNVALLHDYNQYDFTLLVRKD